MMKIKNYDREDLSEVFALWNTSGVRQGFVPADQAAFARFLPEHPYFNEKHAFLLTDGTETGGFICGCTGEDLPGGRERAFFTCLLLSERAEKEENALLLLKSLEASFRKAGKACAVSNFFNPMRLPWTIPDTVGHQHNNAPGIPLDGPLHGWMKTAGYADAAIECAMYLELANFRMPQNYLIKQKNASRDGYTVEWFDKDRHQYLTNMVNGMGNPQWSVEIPQAAEQINMLVALQDKKVVGFAGPVYPEATGRGYFAGIAVAAEHENKGLGSLLFYTLCQKEKEAGARYMSLFTGSDNPAGNIYRKAGFTVKRQFAVMRKEL